MFKNKWIQIAAFAIVLVAGVATAQVRETPQQPSLTGCGTSGTSCKLQSDCCSGYGCDNSGHCRKSGSIAP
jgi:hypothetical protein